MHVNVSKTIMETIANWKKNYNMNCTMWIKTIQIKIVGVCAVAEERMVINYGG